MQQELKKALLSLQNKNYQLSILSTLKSGKEASVFKVSDSNGVIYALKVYKPHENRSFQQQAEYMQGKYFREHSVKKAVSRRTRLGRKIVQDVWIKREGYILKQLNVVQANVPELYEQVENAILLEYIGGDIPAPRLNEVSLDEKIRKKFYGIILGNIELFKSVGIVHGDLSEYNILVWNSKPYIIDFPQAVDIKRNPEWEKYLERDLANIKRFFDKERI